MTEAEANIEAKRRWGPSGFAHHASRVADPEARYEVGYVAGGLPRVCGKGCDWESAFLRAPNPR